MRNTEPISTDTAMVKSRPIKTPIRKPSHFFLIKRNPQDVGIAENLCRAALTYNALTGRDSSNESRREIFFALWNCYLQGL